MQLCRENAVNDDCSITVYATKLQCATRHVTLAILSRDKVARQNRAIKLQNVRHRSKRSSRKSYVTALSLGTLSRICVL